MALPRHNRRVHIRWIQPGEPLGATRGETVVCIPVHGAHEHFVRCLRSVLAHTPGDARILICDDCSPDLRSQEYVRALEQAEGEQRVYYARQELNVGFPANVNSAFLSAAPADVAILNSDCVVAAGWLDGLRQAAYSDSRVATATALTNHGTLVSVPERGMPRRELPAEWNLDDAAAAVRAHSLHLRPRLPTAIGHCVYVRRTGLELVGTFDLAFSPGYGEEVDFSQRCLSVGLSHVVADDVLVYHHGGGSFSANGTTSPVQAAHEAMIEVRYPYYHRAVEALEEDSGGPLARSLSAAGRALKDLHVVIDARILAGPMTGTQLHVLQLIAALARTGEARLTAIVPLQVSGYAREMLASLPGVRLARSDGDALPGWLSRADVLHRPFQIQSHADLSFAGRLADRFIVTQQDLIAFHNPSYFRSFDAWDGYRQMTRSALAVADRVVFFSAHARADALAEDLVEPNRASVVHLGSDHVLPSVEGKIVRPRRAANLPADGEVILCLGTDFRHKNRLFALRVLEQLQCRHSWPGYLVFAGPHVTCGSSTADEAMLMTLRPRIGEAVLDVAAVSEAEKVWMLRRASLVLYPTVHEGFGLIPFEAADHEVPCLWAPGTALSEILPDSAAGIVPWDAALSADRAIELMRDSDARAANIDAVRTAAAKLTWDATATRMLEIYNETCDRPATPASELERRHGRMQPALSDDALRLVGPDGALPGEMERPLLALAMRPEIGKPVFGAIKLTYRAAYRLRRKVAEGSLVTRGRRPSSLGAPETGTKLERRAEPVD